jgi:hypothetical protein
LKALLDTHTLIWTSVTPERLGKKAAKILQDRNNELHVNIASMWEISIKVSKPQHILTLPAGWDQRTEAYMGGVWPELVADSTRSLPCRSGVALAASPRSV